MTSRHGTVIIRQNEILISFAVESTRAEFLPWAKEFVRMGFTFVGTPGTAEFFCNNGVRSEATHESRLRNEYAHEEVVVRNITRGRQLMLPPCRSLS